MNDNSAPQSQQTTSHPLTAAQHAIPSNVLAAAILQMLCRNGIATALHLPKPCSLASLNRLRTRLLRDPFFDPEHDVHELRARLRPARLTFEDAVMIFARLVVVLKPEMGVGVRSMGWGDGREGLRGERVELRNVCLDLPFFDRGSQGVRHPFSWEEDEEDEGCFA